MKHYIVPIDFSEDAMKGLDLAILFSGIMAGNIQLVYIQKKGGDYTPRSAEDEHIFARSQLEALMAKYQNSLPEGSTLDYVIKKGKIYEEVVNQAHSFNESIICMTTHGASGFEELFIGSNAYRIISATSRPVVTIRNGVVPSRIKRIVMPITPNGETRQKVPFTVDLAKAFNAELHVLGVCSTKEATTQKKIQSYTNQAVSFCKSRGIEPMSEYIQGEHVESIIDYSTKVNADLIAVIIDVASGLNLVLGSYNHQLLNRSVIPLINIPPKDIKISGGFSTFGG